MKLKKFGVGAGVSVSLIVGGFLSVTPRAAKPNAVGGARPVGARFRAVDGYGRLPLSFEVNRGQTDARVKFLARGQGYTLFLNSQEAVLSLQRSEASSEEDGKRKNRNSELAAGRFAPFSDPSPMVTERAKPPDAPRPTNAVLQMQLVGANANGRVKGEEELPGKSNYFMGNDPKKWRTNIPTYAKVRAEDVYPGVDLVYYGNQGQLEYDFVVRPGADPSAIKLALTSAPSSTRTDSAGSIDLTETASAKIDVDGDLLVRADGGEVRFHKPVIYQPTTAENGRRTAEKTLVAGRYTINEQTEVSFDISDYDRTKPLVIDPVLAYSTYLGGSGGDSGHAIAVDAGGNAYVTGVTSSTDFPTVNPFQATNNGNGDAFVTKLNADGSALIYSTYLGGSGGDGAYGLAVDGAGSAYLTGITTSTDFPTVNPFQATADVNPSYPNSPTAFVAKLDGTGSVLVYSTYLGGHGGSTGNQATGIAVDSQGNAYVTGYTDARDFPTMSPIQPINRSNSDPATNGFVSELNATGSALVYSTYLGGSGNATNGDSIHAIAVDSSGSAYVTGFTASRDFPTTPTAVQPTCILAQLSFPFAPAGCNEAFVTKISAGGAALAYSTYLDQAVQGNGIASDGSGNAYVTGYVTAGQGAFVAKLNPDGSSLVYFTNLSGSGQTIGTGVALSGPGFAFVTGYTYANNFPTTNPIQATNNAYANGGDNSFVVQLAPDGSGPVYSTYLGGSSRTEGKGIAVDGSGNAYVTGFTGSSDFPTTPNAFQTTNRTFNGYYYAATGFVTKISMGVADLDIADNAPSVALSGSTLTYSITVTNNGPDAASNVNIQDAIPAGTNFNSVATTSGSCTAPAPGGAGTVNCTAPALASGSAITETLTVNVTAGLLSTITDTATVSSTTFDPTSADNSATATTTVI